MCEHFGKWENHLNQYEKDRVCQFLKYDHRVPIEFTEMAFNADA